MPEGTPFIPSPCNLPCSFAKQSGGMLPFFFFKAGVGGSIKQIKGSKRMDAEHLHSAPDPAALLYQQLGVFLSNC